MKKEPTFSVIVPTFNRAVMLNRAVESIFRQSFQDFEVVVVDDGSAQDYVNSASWRHDSRVRTLCLEANSGAAAARNKGLQMAYGRFVAFLDDDDEYLPTFLEATHAHFAAQPRNTAIAWCGIRYVEHGNGTAGSRVWNRTFHAECASQKGVLESLMSIGIGSGISVRAECLAQVGAFDHGLKAVEDTDLFLRIVASGFAATLVPGVHMVVHHHELPRLTDVTHNSTRLKECRLLIARHGRVFESHPSLLSQITLHIEHLCAQLQTVDHVG